MALDVDKPCQSLFDPHRLNDNNVIQVQDDAYEGIIDVNDETVY